MFIPTVKYRFPSELKGVIDGIGRSELEVSLKELTITGRKIPSSYSGSISRKGEIAMTLKKTSTDYFGADSIWKISCNLFRDQPEKGESFLLNRDKILNKVRQVWTTLESTPKKEGI